MHRASLLLLVLTACSGEPDRSDDEMVDAHGNDGGTASSCGDDACDPRESCDGCPEDCGQCPAGSDGGPPASGAGDAGASADAGTSADPGTSADRDPRIHFSSGFSGIRICDQDGDCATSPLASSYYECTDAATFPVGTDSVTGDRWPSRGESPGDMPGNANQNYFQEVVINGAPDCCASGCTASALSQCHQLEIVSSDQHDGSRGEVLMLQPLEDCSSRSYSRLQYNMYDASPPTGNGWEDFSEFYYEVWMRFPNLDTALGSHAGIAELYMPSDWKLAIVLQRDGGRPVLKMKNGSNRTAHYDNACVPEENTWFKLRVWYRAGQADGHWKATFTCPDCSTPVPETVIKEWRGRTQRDDEDPDVVSPLKNALSYGLQMQLDDFRFGEYSVEP